MASDDDAAAAGGDGGVDTVFNVEAGSAAGVTEDGGVFVGTDAADVEDAGWGEDVLLRETG